MGTTRDNIVISAHKDFKKASKKLRVKCKHIHSNDLTQGLGDVRNIICHDCGAHWYKDKFWTKKEWDDKFVNAV